MDERGRRVYDEGVAGEPVVLRQPAEQRAVVRRERRGLGQLRLVRFDQDGREVRRERGVLEGQPVEEVAEALGRGHLAVVDGTQPFGLLPRRGERLVALGEADRRRVGLEQRVQAARRRADGAPAHVDLRQPLAVEVHEGVEEVEEDRVVAAWPPEGRAHSGFRLAKPSSMPCPWLTAVSPYFQHRFTTRPPRRCGKSTSPTARSLMMPPIAAISPRPAFTVSVSRATRSVSAFHAARSMTPPPASPIRSRSASSRPAIVVASSFARITPAISRVSVVISRSTSAGSK